MSCSTTIPAYSTINYLINHIIRIYDFLNISLYFSEYLIIIFFVLICCNSIIYVYHFLIYNPLYSKLLSLGFKPEAIEDYPTQPSRFKTIILKKDNCINGGTVFYDVNHAVNGGALESVCDLRGGFFMIHTLRDGRNVYGLFKTVSRNYASLKCYNSAMARENVLIVPVGMQVRTSGFNARTYE